LYGDGAKSATSDVIAHANAWQEHHTHARGVTAWHRQPSTSLPFNAVTCHRYFNIKYTAAQKLARETPSVEWINTDSAFSKASSMNE
jgi:hypothetical protein